MIEKLPYGGFEWKHYTEDEVINYNYSDDTGIIVECDLEYPEELHDLHNEYPLAPESRNIITILFLFFKEEHKKK